jgi:hypothetical protein
MAMLELESNLKSDGIRGASHHRWLERGTEGCTPFFGNVCKSALNAHVGKGQDSTMCTVAATTN